MVLFNKSALPEKGLILHSARWHPDHDFDCKNCTFWHHIAILLKQNDNFWVPVHFGSSQSPILIMKTAVFGKEHFRTAGSFQQICLSRCKKTIDQSLDRSVDRWMVDRWIDQSDGWIDQSVDRSIGMVAFSNSAAWWHFPSSSKLTHVTMDRTMTTTITMTMIMTMTMRKCWPRTRLNSLSRFVGK